MPATMSTDRTALMVIDMQNGFCHPEGSFAGLGLDVSMTNDAIGGASKLVDAARAGGVPIIFTRYVYRTDYRDGGVLVQDLLPALADTKSLAAGMAMDTSAAANTGTSLMPSPTINTTSSFFCNACT